MKEKPKRPQLGPLPEESSSARRALAQSLRGEAMQARVKAYASTAPREGRYFVNKRVQRIAPIQARKFFAAKAVPWMADENQSSNAAFAGAVVTFNVSLHEFRLNGAPVPPGAMQGVADAVVNGANFRIADLALRLRNGEIALADWYAAMQQEIILLHGAQQALAVGGFEMMDDRAWNRAAQNAERQLEYLRNFAEQIHEFENGGAAARGGDVLSDAFLQRVGLYADAGRATYENEHARDHADVLGHTWAERVLGAVDHCPDCVEWAAMGRIPVDEMLENYPIGASACRTNCHCIIVTGVD